LLSETYSKGAIMAGNVLTAVVLLMTGAALTTPVPASQPTAVGMQAQAVLAKVSISKGVCVILGLPEAGQPSFVTDLASGNEFLVYFQSPDGVEELVVRKAAQAAGLPGKRVFVDRGSWRHIHLADNLAGLVWLSPEAQRAKRSRQAVSRGGRCLELPLSRARQQSAVPG
jgi:hypothetical protein